MKNMLNYFKSIVRSHSLVYENDKSFFLDRVIVTATLFIGILFYSFISTGHAPSIKDLGFITILSIVIILLLDFIIFPLASKSHILGYNLNGTWEGEFIIEEPEKKKLPIKKFQIKDFGRRCLITVETDSFLSNSIVAKVESNQGNTIKLTFVYFVHYATYEKGDHLGITELTIFKDTSLPRGEYYTRDNNQLRYGKIHLTKQIEK